MFLYVLSVIGIWLLRFIVFLIALYIAVRVIRSAWRA